MSESQTPTTKELLDKIAVLVDQILANSTELKPQDIASLGNLVLRMRIRDDIQDEKQGMGSDLVAFPALPPRQLDLFGDANE